MQRRHAVMTIVAACLFILLYLCGMVPTQREMQKMQQVEQELAEQVETARQRVIRQGLNAEKNQNMDTSLHLLTDLGVLAKINRLQVQSISRMREKNKIRLQLLGDYSRVSMFMRALSEQAHLLYISDFSFKPARGEEVQLLMELAIVNTSEKLHMLIAQPVSADKDIFCRRSKYLMQTDTEFPVQQIRMAGYMNIANVPSAIIELPDGREQQVAIGSVLGVEKAKVAAIKNNQIELKMANGNRFIINRNF